MVKYFDTSGVFYIHAEVAYLFCTHAITSNTDRKFTTPLLSKLIQFNNRFKIKIIILRIYNTVDYQ